jgi:hypothetical protein
MKALYLYCTYDGATEKRLIHVSNSYVELVGVKAVSITMERQFKKDGRMPKDAKCVYKIEKNKGDVL